MCLYFKVDAPVFAGAGASGLVTADLNADGLTDVVVLAKGARQVVVLRGDGHGGFSNATPIQLHGAPTDAAVGNFGDGDVLVVAAGTTGESAVIRGDGKGGYSVQDSPHGLPPGKNLLGVAKLGPFEQQVVDANVPTQQLNLLIRGAGSVPIPGAPAALAVGDLNGDGFDDVVVATGDRIVVFDADGHGGLAAPQTYLGVPGAKSMLTADLTGTGRNDIVVASESRGVDTVSVLPNKGAAGFGPPIQTFVNYDVFGTFSTAAPAVAVGKFGGAHLDVVVADRAGVYLLRGDGHGGFDQNILVYDPNFSVPYASPTSVAVTTLKPGGRPDIVVTYSNGTLRVIHTAQHPFNPPAAAPNGGASGALGGAGGAELLLGLGLSVALRRTRKPASRNDALADDAEVREADADG